ncbi:MAG TPA: class I SAM-dependent methyltransferase [Candidatus Aquilonibacter sp.]|nr:class I SAM-dependent methyltransferase [Candidatus Aquilonibacter sp.]
MTGVPDRIATAPALDSDTIAVVANGAARENHAAEAKHLALAGVAGRCPLCLSPQTRTLFHDQGRRLDQCRSCGASFLVPQPFPSSVAARFQNENPALLNDLHRRFEKNRERVLRRVARQIQRRRTHGRILDVGCASGFFLARFFAESHWQRRGVELSPVKAQAAVEKCLQVHTGDVHSANFGPNGFDVVTVLDAFYYFPRPQVELGEFRRILSSEGLLALELPWAASRIWRRSGTPRRFLSDRRVPLLESSDHLFYYTPKAVTQLLEHCGFRVLAMIPLPGNRQESMVREMFCRTYSWLSQLMHWLSRGRCFLGPRFLVLAKKS